MTTYTATYSPDDNKLRLYASSRLDAETYAKAKALGFRWAPKQELFVAPAWSPGREDFLAALAGEIEDEDKSLVERAEERAERFEDYGDKRLADAESARKAVDAIADNIPFGQPILVGHHSERHARKDAERIENGMRRAVKMWETSQYWTARAAGALQAAKYKELPGVRHRRIKTLESEKRKVEKTKSESEMWLYLWTECGDEPDADLQRQVALRIANMCWLHLPRKEGDREDFAHTPTAYDALNNSHPTLYAPRTLDEIVDHAKKVYPATVAHCERWIAHYENRLAYERAMLAEQIGESGELGPGMGGRFDIKPGGKVLVRGEWHVVVRVNKSHGTINSVTTTRWKYGIEKVADYQPPTEETAARAKKITAQPPICNYPVDGCVNMTEAEWKELMKRKWSDFPYYGVVGATAAAGRHRVRQKPAGMMKKLHVFITDSKRVDPPKPEPVEPKESSRVTLSIPGVGLGPVTGFQVPDEPTVFDTMKASLKAGVKVVVAPQLFPTPPEVADEMVALAEITKDDIVLEPEAGTGNLIDAVKRSGVDPISFTAIEQNHSLRDGLVARRERGEWWSDMQIVAADFLSVTSTDPSNGGFTKVLMNPPFENGSDIKHVEHALEMLRPGGKLVAIVAGGPRQERAFKDRASHWQELPSGTFAGTGVRSILMAIDKEG